MKGRYDNREYKCVPKTEIDDTINGYANTTNFKKEGNKYTATQAYWDNVMMVSGLPYIRPAMLTQAEITADPKKDVIRMTSVIDCDMAKTLAVGAAIVSASIAYLV